MINNDTFTLEGDIDQRQQEIEYAKNNGSMFYRIREPLSYTVGGPIVGYTEKVL